MKKKESTLEQRREYIKERCSDVKNKPLEFKRIADELFLSKDTVKKDYYTK